MEEKENCSESEVEGVGRWNKIKYAAGSARRKRDIPEENRICCEGSAEITGECCVL